MGKPSQQKEGRLTGYRESDPLVVLGGRENRPQGEAVDKDSQHAKETGAGHVGSDKRLPTSLQAIANKAKKEQKHRFRGLYAQLNEEFLLQTWRRIRKNAASGVDGVSAREYEQNLVENIRNLVLRLKQKRYRAKLVRRHWIPKGDGKLRPLGIPTVEDKLLQAAVAAVLSAIYEQDFLRCSFGYRPGVGAHDAIGKLTVKLQFGKYNHVVDVDLENFFGTIDHAWMLRMLAQRIDDKPFLRLVGKWMRAGVLETDGQVIHPSTGTPQGGTVSPVLANIYLHYVLDLWFHKVVVRRMRGEACLVRYADDFVCAFEREEDATRFMAALRARVEKFGLKISEKKTRMLQFNRTARRAERFDFLGFEFSWGRDRKSQPHLKRRTSRKSLRASVERFTQWCRDNRRKRLRPLFASLNRKLQGYYQYYGVYDNSRSIKQFFHITRRILYKWLNRRSQRRSFNWTGFTAALEAFGIPTPHCPKSPRALS